MMIKHAAEKAPERLTLKQISDRLCLANLASFHQTAVAISNILINIAASDAEFDTSDVLRQEMTTVLADHGGVFTKAAAARMVHTDSVLRESMRTHAFGARAMIRKVVAPGGVTTPDGHVLPYESTLSIVSYPVHHDPDIYDNPEKFDPFRFSRQTDVRPGTDGMAHDDTVESDIDGPHLSFVTTGPTYLPFGHGKHACPGRFLVSLELKMLLYHILTAYDVELLPEHNGVRPAPQWVTEAVMPPVGVKLKFKTRTV